MIYKNQKIIVANWKMNPVSFDEVNNLVSIIRKNIKKTENVKVVICSPSIFISKINNNKSFDLGIQNVFWEDQGAYTGEISAKMAKNMDIEYAIVGHSERRLYMKETDEMINQKIQSVLNSNLKPILCVGETADEKNQDLASDVIISQIEKALMGVNKSKIPNILIAYEPVWAIGTGEIPSINEIMSTVLLVRKIITNLYDRATAERVFVLYGGSVNGQNAFDIVDKTGMNGLLIGSASLNGSEFVRIVNLFG
ncbi:MAG: triose-phosphate isomerase [Patescibacteria group bacterium]|nr:triose-phosphate isomerase [Patescibacteria group bacterium]